MSEEIDKDNQQQSNDEFISGDSSEDDSSENEQQQIQSQEYEQYEEDDFIICNSPTNKFNLYKFISDPNPLMKPEQREDYYIRNAVDQELIDLPNFYDEMREKEENANETMDENFLDFGQCLDNLKDNFLASEQLNQEEKQLKSLFRFHHDDPNARIVYKRYYDLFPNKYYASYICDLKNVLKNKNELIFRQLNSNPQAEKEKHIRLEKNDLIFNSRFESGNLFQAWKVSANEYNLILQNDINSKGNTQWFFFSAANTQKGSSITFNIINQNKKSSLFQKGMLPCVYSLKRKEQTNAGWKREGYGIKYYKSNIQKEGQQNRSYYTLSFKYTFQYSDDTVYFAYSYPYTYSHLNEYLKRLEEDPQKKQYIHRKIGCKTLARNNMDVITITSSSLFKREKRKMVYFMARQHPGEITGSYMIEGIMDFLTENTPEAETLRQHYVFKIVPMINPDGVIHGNNRCSLAGVDLNRKWKNAHSKLHPCINYIKNMVKKNLQTRETKLLIDFHGHSKKLNAFFYGNTYYSQPELTRILPMLVSKYEPRVKFENCRFTVQRYYESTARIALWRMLRIPNVFTLEASFYGYQNEQGTSINFTPKSYMQIGRSICKSLYQMLQDEIKVHPEYFIPIESEEEMLAQKKKMKDEKSKKIKPLKEQQESSNSKDCILESVINDLQNQKLIDLGEAECSGSDSSCSEDDLDDDLFNKIIPKQLQNKSNKNIKKKKKKETKENQQNILKQEKKDPSKLPPPPPQQIQAASQTIQPEQKERIRYFKYSSSRERSCDTANLSKRSIKKTEKQTQTDDFQDQNSFNFLKKTQDMNIFQEIKGKQPSNQLPPRPYFIRNSNNYQNSISQQLNSDLLHSYGLQAADDDNSIINKANPYIIQRSIEEGRLSNGLIKNFCITGQKVKEDQLIGNIKQIEVFKSPIYNCREVQTQTCDLVQKLRQVAAKQDKQQQQLEMDNMNSNKRQQCTSIDNDSTSSLPKQYFNRKTNFTLNGPTLNQILMYSNEDNTHHTNHHINHNKLSSNSNPFRNRNLSENQSKDTSLPPSGYNLNSQRNTPPTNNRLNSQIPFSVLKQEFQKAINKQSQKEKKQSLEKNNLLQINNGNNNNITSFAQNNNNNNINNNNFQSQNYSKQYQEFQDTLSMQKISLKQNDGMSDYQQINKNEFDIGNTRSNKRSLSSHNQQILQNQTINKANQLRPSTNQIKQRSQRFQEYDENTHPLAKISRNKSTSSSNNPQNQLNQQRTYIIKQRKSFGIPL